MGINTIGMLEDTVAVEDIASFIREHVADDKNISVIISELDKNLPLNERYAQIRFSYKEESRMLSIGLYPSDAVNCYGLDKKYARICDLSYWGHSGEIMTKIVSNFGGFYLADDCSGDIIPIFTGTKKEVSEESKLIAKLQVAFGDDAMTIYKHWNEIKEML